MIAPSMNDPIAIVGRTAVSQTRVMLDAYVVLNYEHLPLPTLAGEQYLDDDAFVVTAYLTDKPKTGDTLWPIN